MTEENTTPSAVPIPLEAPKLPLEISAAWVGRALELQDHVSELAQDDPQAWLPEKYEEAGLLLRAASRHSSDLETERKKLARPFLDAQRKIKAVADKAREPLEAAKAKLQAAMRVYLTEAEKAPEKGAWAPEEGAPTVREVVPTEEGLATAPPKVDGASIRTEIKFRVADQNRVPATLRTVDERKIRAFLATVKDTILPKLRAIPEPQEIIPGVLVWLERKVVPR